MRRMGLDVASLPALEAALPGAPWPGPVDLFPAHRDSVPDVLRDEPQSLICGDVPLGLRLGELTDPARPWIVSRLGAVPDPATNVLLVPQKPGDRSRRPAVSDPSAAFDTGSV